MSKAVECCSCGRVSRVPMTKYKIVEHGLIGEGDAQLHRLKVLPVRVTPGGGGGMQPIECLMPDME